MSKTGSVVGWDGSSGADRALGWAGAREDSRGGVLDVVRVLEPDGREPDRRVQEARDALRHAVAALADRYPRLSTTAELLIGDPVTELARAGGPDRLLVLGASRIDRVRQPDARRIPVALAARPSGATAIVPDGPDVAGGEDGRAGVVVAVSGHDSSGAALEFAVTAARDLGSSLTVLRLHDPHDLVVAVTPPDFEHEVERLRAAHPDVETHLAEGWAGSPFGLLSRADRSALLVLEGRRPSAAPPRFSFERALAGWARTPFVVVADPPPPAVGGPSRSKLALAV